ncbi:MAG: hypothetical protein HOP27_08425 [Anaerolineales bacterium]|nr:hypothetical protein [Anaerolineales bacterium]
MTEPYHPFGVGNNLPSAVYNHDIPSGFVFAINGENVLEAGSTFRLSATRFVSQKNAKELEFIKEKS